MTNIKVFEFDRTMPKFQNIINDENTMINIITLKKGEDLPKHNTNSNVYLTVLKGSGKLDSGGNIFDLRENMLLNIEKGTEMYIYNENSDILSFCVTKIPNPNNLKG
ncbi:MAG: hypothetical protein HPY70_05790 [Firmicutes bacterium]|nr:hypothetical protein [Bacillota bacterium]